MKKRCLMFILTILFISIMYAQEEESPKNYKFGISASLEKGQDILLDEAHLYTETGFSKITFPQIIKSVVKLTPEISFHNRSGVEHGNYSLWQLGMGAYYIFHYKDIYIYTGPRFGIEILNSSFYSDDNSKDTRKYYILGLSLGFEYFLSQNFSFGTEFQTNKYFEEKKNNYDYDRSYLSIVPSIYLSYYIQ